MRPIDDQAFHLDDYILTVTEFILTGVTGQSSRVGVLEILTITSKLACDASRAGCW